MASDRLSRREGPGNEPGSSRSLQPSESGEWSDQAIVAALRRGDLRAAQALYGRVEHVVTGALLQVLGRGDRDQEDLAQLALERIVVSLVGDGYRGDCSLRTWASVISVRLAVDTLRRRRTERRLFADVDACTDARELPPAAQRPDQEVDARRKLAALRQALAALSPGKAETVLLFEVLGHDLAEIATMTGVTVAAAQTRLVRGRKELRERLLRTLGEEDGS